MSKTQRKRSPPTCQASNAWLSAVDDKVRFYLLDGQTYGPYSEIVHYHAKELQGLLAIMEGILANADMDLDTVIHSLSDALKREAAA